MIYIKAVREAYNDCIIYEIIWIRRNFNLADGMKKHTILSELVQAVDECRLHYEVEHRSVER